MLISYFNKKIQTSKLIATIFNTKKKILLMCQVPRLCPIVLPEVLPIFYRSQNCYIVRILTNLGCIAFVEG
jgi:hypothetical protein